jgi:hypothetical protein
MQSNVTSNLNPTQLVIRNSGVDPVVQIAIVVAVGSAITALSASLSPIILARINNRLRTRERAEDFERQDAVTRRTEEVARIAAVNATDTRTQLKQIHTLVNSDMTAARQSELDQTILSLALMRRVISLIETVGQEPSTEDLATIEQTEKRIIELRAMLADRLVQMKEVEAATAVADQPSQPSQPSA